MPEAPMAASPAFGQAQIVEFFKQIASHAGVQQEDLIFIFNVPPGERTRLPREPTKITFHLHDRYYAAFDCTTDNNAVLMSGESQRNKTTSLLCIATLLGYPWDRPDYLRFLGNEEFINKGRALRSSLSNGIEAKLAVARGTRRIAIALKDGQGVVSHTITDLQQEHTFDLRQDWEAFESYMSTLLDLELVSKGRGFIERVGTGLLNLATAPHKELSSYEFRAVAEACVGAGPA